MSAVALQRSTNRIDCQSTDSIGEAETGQLRWLLIIEDNRLYFLWLSLMGIIVNDTGFHTLSLMSPC